MSHERDTPQERQAAALERIADAFEATLELLAAHVLGGMSPEEVEELQRQARTITRLLRQSRQSLSSALEDAQKPPSTETPT